MAGTSAWDCLQETQQLSNRRLEFTYASFSKRCRRSSFFSFLSCSKFLLEEVREYKVCRRTIYFSSRFFFFEVNLDCACCSNNYSLISPVSRWHGCFTYLLPQSLPPVRLLLLLSLWYDDICVRVSINLHGIIQTMCMF